MMKELEWTLEQLTWSNEQDWIAECDVDADEKYSLGEKFIFFTKQIY